MIWQDSDLSLESFDERDYCLFFNYIGNELEDLRQYHLKFAVDTFDNMNELFQCLRTNSAEPLSFVLERLSERFVHADRGALQRSLELAVRLFLTINVNSSSMAMGATFPYEIPLEWPPDASLSSLIERQFSKPNASLKLSVRSSLNHGFTAAYLVNICGIELHWTDNLADHLRLDRQKQILIVYKHKIWLLNHLKALRGSLIPKEVLSETLDTLNLLFPFGDPATRQLLIREGQRPFYGLGNCNRYRNLGLGRYVIYREPLEDLFEVYQKPPRTLKQLMVDRRDMMN